MTPLQKMLLSRSGPAVVKAKHIMRINKRILAQPQEVVTQDVWSELAKTYLDKGNEIHELYGPMRALAEHFPANFSPTGRLAKKQTFGGGPDMQNLPLRYNGNAWRKNELHFQRYGGHNPLGVFEREAGWTFPDTAEAEGHTDVQRINRVPPTHREKECIARVTNSVDYLNGLPIRSDERLPADVLVYVQSTKDAAVVLQAKHLKRRDEPPALAADQLGVKEDHRVMMQGRMSTAGTEPEVTGVSKLMTRDEFWQRADILEQRLKRGTKE